MQKNPLFSSLVISAAVQKVVWIVTKRVKNSPKDYLNIFFFLNRKWFSRESEYFLIQKSICSRCRVKKKKKEGNRQFSWHT